MPGVVPLVSGLAPGGCWPSATSPESSFLLDLLMMMVIEGTSHRKFWKPFADRPVTLTWTRTTAHCYSFRIAWCVSDRQLLWDSKNDTIHLCTALWFSKPLSYRISLDLPPNPLKQAGVVLSLFPLFTFL